MSTINRYHLRQTLNYTIATSAAVSVILHGFNHPVAKKIGKLAKGVLIVSGAMRYCLPALSAEEEKIVQLAPLILTKDATEIAKEATLDAIKAIPAAEREDVVQKVLIVTQAMQSEEEVDPSIFRVIANTPRSERENVVRQAYRLITPGMRVWSVVHIISEVRKIPVAEREDVVTHVILALTNMPALRRWEPDLNFLFSQIAAGPRDVRRNIVEKMLALNPPQDLALRGLIIEKINALPPAEREDVFQHALTLITARGMTSFHNIEEVFRSLLAIPTAEERAEVVRHALPFLNLLDPNPTPQQIRAMIADIDSISPEHRDGILPHVLRFLTRVPLPLDNRFYPLNVLVGEIALIPENQIEDVLQRAIPFVTQEIPAPNRAVIIRTIAAISPDERASVLDPIAGFGLILPTMSAFDRRAIIDAVSTIHPTQRHDAVQQAARLLTPEMNIIRRIDILREVHMLPSAIRAAVVQDAMQLDADSRVAYIQTRGPWAAQARVPLAGLQPNGPQDGPNATLGTRLQSWDREYEREFPDHLHLRATTDFAPFLASLNEDETNNLREYLKGISQIEDMQHDATPEAVKNVIRRVENMIQLACINPVFKTKMLNLVEQGIETCHDRLLLSFNDIEVLYELYRIDRPDGAFIAAAANAGVYQLLTQHAQNISIKKILPDPIETILAYQLALREDLSLPITTQRMSSEGAGFLDGAMVTEARIHIESYSIRQVVERTAEWQERMCLRFPREAQAVRDKYEGIYAGAKKYYDRPKEERAAWLETWTAKHPEYEWLKTLVSDPNVKNYVDAGDAIQEPQGIELAHLGGILNELLPLEAHEGKR